MQARRRDYMTIVRPTQQTQSSGLAPVPVKLEEEELAAIEAAGTIRKKIPFPVTCGFVRGVPTFFAQLKGGKRFGVVPVMPRNGAGEPICPALNGERGFLTIEMSENAQFEWLGHRLQVSIRPTLADWEPLATATSEEG